MRTAPLDPLIVATPIDPSREVIKTRGLVRMTQRRWESREARIQFWVFALSDGRKHHQRISKMLSIPEWEVRAAITELTKQTLVTFEVHKKMDETLNTELLHASFARIKPFGMLFAEAFYTRLFQKYPGVRHLFKPDMQEQYAKFLAMLAFIVLGVFNNDAIEKDLRALGARHQEYGAEPAHYGAVSMTLLETLKWCYHEYLHEAWTPELQQTWEQAIQLVAGIMQRASA